MKQVWQSCDGLTFETEEECRGYEKEYYSKRKMWIAKLYNVLDTLDKWCTECRCEGCPIKNELCDRIPGGLRWTNCLDETAREVVENEVEN